MSPLDSSLHDAVAGGYDGPDDLQYRRVTIPADHPSIPTCPFHPLPQEA